MVNCIIIEDEPLAIGKLTHFISKLDSIKLLQSFNSAITAVDYLRMNKVDLIFLDIEMKDLTGIQFLESVHIDSKVIITTAYEQYAIKGFDLQVCDYLLKPISFERFLQAINKANEELMQSRDQKKVNKIFIKTEYRLEGIDTSEILYIEGMGDYRKIVTVSKKIMTLQSFGELLNILPQELFCRVHNSFVVSLDKIERIERNRIKIKDKTIPISESYNKDFYLKINS
ncbi:LytR/AlgR family response regulator transcription factor [Parabacteroides timonensis]|uniref:LytR/AlgR family response regulator transcription factor n=1 Tax=Parabacteroides timonensis TaxID=1871013 RepID=UPI00094EA085|nr:response regulator transcription factor [Parabacteroides timonensis]